MKIKTLMLTFTLAFSLSAPMLASAETRDFGTCMIDALNGKERKQLVKWIFLSMAIHPELEEFTKITDENRLAADKNTGALITRLFVEDCPAEASAANKRNPLEIQKAFELVGQVAMQGIMANQEVMNALTRYVAYTDQNKINALFVE